MVKNGDDKQRYKLKDYRGYKKKLFSPMSKLLEEEKIKLISWMNDRLPDMLWACLVASLLPRVEALKIFQEVAELGFEFRGQHQKYNGIDITHPGLLCSPQEILIFRIVKLVTAHLNGYEALRPLLLVDSLPGKSIWQKALSVEKSRDTDWNVLAQAVGKALYHQSQEATDVRWLRVMFKAGLGVVKFFDHLAETAEGIVSYPYLDEVTLQKIRPSIRALEGAFDSFVEVDSISGKKNNWSNLFWRECLIKTDCIPLRRRLKSSRYDKKIVFSDMVCVHKTIVNAFSATLETTDVDAKHDSVFGLGLYSLTLLRELLISRGCQGIIGRLVIRTLVECHITLSYLIIQNDYALWEKFRKFGISQSMLNLIKLLEMGDGKPSFISESTLEQLANQDMSEDFIAIDLGHWDGKNLRELADLSGTKNDYDKYYGWSSVYSHGHWSAINDSCFLACINPLHKLHRVPIWGYPYIEDSLPDAIYLVNRILSGIEKSYPIFSAKIKPFVLNRHERIIDKIERKINNFGHKN